MSCSLVGGVPSEFITTSDTYWRFGFSIHCWAVRISGKEADLTRQDRHVTVTVLQQQKHAVDQPLREPAVIRLPTLVQCGADAVTTNASASQQC
jgi:hypothetical protein